VFGDYDVDGVTAAAIMYLSLSQLAKVPDLVRVRLPTRAEGYGLNSTALKELADQGVDLLVAVDCASTDEDGVGYARSLGMDVLIVDHHHMSGSGPEGAITISPARPDAGTYREMSAAGLSLLVIAALTTRIPGAEDICGSLMDLAALGTVADVSSMLGANRQIVREGLRAMRRDPRVGILALCDVAGIDVRSVSTSAIGFAIAPRLNAAGRMNDPKVALDLLLTNDVIHARSLATELEGLNRQRKVETDLVLADVMHRLEASNDRRDMPILVESSSRWSPGVLGLAAGQLAERSGRPVILLNELGEIASGSCRSVPGVNVVHALERHAHLIERYGGHSQAAGLTLKRANIDALRDALNCDSAAFGVSLPVDPILRLDAVIGSDDLTLDMAKAIMRLSPFGIDNPEPVLRLNGVIVQRTETMGKDGSHLRLVFRGARGEIRAPFFGAAHRAAEIRAPQKLDLACSLSVSQWNGPRLDVKVLDFRSTVPG
jgi:single-stranded-DNA-specific exonuclease